MIKQTAIGVFVLSSIFLCLSLIASLLVSLDLYMVKNPSEVVGACARFAIVAAVSALFAVKYK